MEIIIQIASYDEYESLFFIFCKSKRKYTMMMMIAHIISTET